MRHFLEFSHTVPRLAPACLLTTIKGTLGVLVTGGTDYIADPDDSYPGRQTDFYELETDSWISLADTWYPVQDHQMVLYENKPSIIGGEYDYQKRAEVQVYYEFSNKWYCCIPSLNYKRSKFVAVSVEMQEP